MTVTETIESVPGLRVVSACRAASKPVWYVLVSGEPGSRSDSGAVLNQLGQVLDYKRLDWPASDFGRLCVE